MNTRNHFVKTRVPGTTLPKPERNPQQTLRRFQRKPCRRRAFRIQPVLPEVRRAALARRRSNDSNAPEPFPRCAVKAAQWRKPARSEALKTRVGTHRHFQAPPPRSGPRHRTTSSPAASQKETPPRRRKVRQRKEVIPARGRCRLGHPRQRSRRRWKR